MSVETCQSPERFVTNITLVRRAVERSLGGDVGIQGEGTHRARNPFDGNIWDDVQCVNSGRDVVSSNLVVPRFNMRSNSGRTLEFPFTERAFAIALVMGKGLLMLRRIYDSEVAGGALKTKLTCNKALADPKWREHSEHR